MKNISEILNKKNLNKDNIIDLLSTNTSEDLNKILNKALEVKEQYIGKKVHFRGLIEFSNKCAKDCYYCGIRGANQIVTRYEMPDEEIINSAVDAYNYKYGSIVLQSGERSDSAFISKICTILKSIKEKTNDQLGITLSVGEQDLETYRLFKESGAHRFLLRIETTNRELYNKIHPIDHSFEDRIACLKNLQKLGYQTGTGVMIGMPFQTIENLADDLIFFRDFSIDMVGMGPYIEHEDTPLYSKKPFLLTKKERFDMSLKMIAILRIMMKDINIASATALQAIDPEGREKALLAGANIIMPNMTPIKYRKSYQLYEDKPCVDEDASKCRGCLAARMASIGEQIQYEERGDSRHYFKRIQKQS